MVPQAHVGDGLLVVLDVLGRDLVGGGEGFVGHLLQTVRLAGELDVAVDVGALLGQFGRIDLQTLHDRG